MKDTIVLVWIFLVIALGLLVAGFIWSPLNYIRAGIFAVGALVMWLWKVRK